MPAFPYVMMRFASLTNWRTSQELEAVSAGRLVLGAVQGRLVRVLLLAIVSVMTSVQSWHVSDDAPQCFNQAALYVSDQGRHGWVRRVGATARVPPLRVFEFLFDDDQVYILFGRDPRS